MEEGTSGIGANRNGHGGLDPEELARRIRQLAIDAHRILTRPDTSIGEVSGLRRRVRVLLRETRGGLRATEIDRWLRAAQRAIEAELHLGPREDLELPAPRFVARLKRKEGAESA